MRRGDNGSVVLFWQFKTKRLGRDREVRPMLDREGKPVYEIVSLDRSRSHPYTVFNAEQYDGQARRELLAAAQGWDPIEQAERVLAGSGATIENSRNNRAYYDLLRDRMILSYRKHFRSGPA